MSAPDRASNCTKDFPCVGGAVHTYPHSRSITAAEEKALSARYSVKEPVPGMEAPLPAGCQIRSVEFARGNH
jgi:hypothetical protein